MSKDIIGFYKGAATSQKGLYVSDVDDMTNEQLESDCYYIQWIFPLPEASKAVPDTPILRQADINEFRESYELRGAMLKMALKMFDFYGFKVRDGESTGKIVKADNFDERSKEWLTSRNHNFLRLTRIVRSTKLLGLEGLAKNFYNCLCEIYEENKGIVGPYTKQFWDEAIEKDV